MDLNADSSLLGEEACPASSCDDDDGARFVIVDSVLRGSAASTVYACARLAEVSMCARGQWDEKTVIPTTCVDRSYKLTTSLLSIITKEKCNQISLFIIHSGRIYMDGGSLGHSDDRPVRGGAVGECLGVAAIAVLIVSTDARSSVPSARANSGPLSTYLRIVLRSHLLCIGANTRAKSSRTCGESLVQGCLDMIDPLRNAL